MKFTVVVLQSKHRDEPWVDTLYYNVQSGWEDKLSQATHFLGVRPKESFVSGPSIGLTAKEAIKLLGLEKNNGTGERCIARTYKVSRGS